MHLDVHIFMHWSKKNSIFFNLHCHIHGVHIILTVHRPRPGTGSKTGSKGAIFPGVCLFVCFAPKKIVSAYFSPDYFTGTRPDSHRSLPHATFRLEHAWSSFQKHYKSESIQPVPGPRFRWSFCWPCSRFRWLFRWPKFQWAFRRNLKTWSKDLIWKLHQHVLRILVEKYRFVTTCGNLAAPVRGPGRCNNLVEKYAGTIFLKYAGTIFLGATPGNIAPFEKFRSAERKRPGQGGVNRGQYEKESKRGRKESPANHMTFVHDNVLHLFGAQVGTQQPHSYPHVPLAPEGDKTSYVLPSQSIPLSIGVIPFSPHKIIIRTNFEFVTYHEG